MREKSNFIPDEVLILPRRISHHSSQSHHLSLGQYVCGHAVRFVLPGVHPRFQTKLMKSVSLKIELSCSMVKNVRKNYGLSTNIGVSFYLSSIHKMQAETILKSHHLKT